MQIQGRFILCSCDEFDNWLAAVKASRAITLIQNHHTWSPSYAHFNGSNHYALLHSMEDFHIRERGFDMIAQNLTTFPDGTVAVCRPLDRIPAGIKGANQKGICIEHLGNFDQGGDTMTAAQRDTIIRVNAALCRCFGLVPSTGSLVYHHWYDLDSGTRTNGSGTTKSCPGTNFFSGNSVAAAEAGFVPLVRQALSNRAGWAVAIPSTTQTATVTPVLLNVRNGAGVHYAVLKQLQHGTAVPLYEQRDGWCRIAAERQEWVCERYLKR